MGYYRLGLATVAALCLFLSLRSEPASAAIAAAFAIHADRSVGGGGERIDRRVLHRHRARSFYCYPQNYWWFYRPYTTALDGHARCMPYFHYLEPYGGRGAKPQRYVK